MRYHRPRRLLDSIPSKPVPCGQTTPFPLAYGIFAGSIRRVVAERTFQTLQFVEAVDGRTDPEDMNSGSPLGVRCPNQAKRSGRGVVQTNPTLRSIVRITESIFPFNTCFARLMRRQGQCIYESEINCSISSFWGNGWDVRLGDEMNGFVAFAECKSLGDVAPLRIIRSGGREQTTVASATSTISRLRLPA